MLCWGNMGQNLGLIVEWSVFRTVFFQGNVGVMEMEWSVQGPRMLLKPR